MMDFVQRFGMWILAGVAAFLVYRWLTMQRSPGYEHDLQEILTSDKYKVKRKFEE